MNEYTSKPPQSPTSKWKGAGLRILGYVLFLLAISSYILWLIEAQAADIGEGYISGGMVFVLRYGRMIAVLLGFAGAFSGLYSFAGNQKNGKENDQG